MASPSTHFSALKNLAGALGPPRGYRKKRSSWEESACSLSTHKYYYGSERVRQGQIGALSESRTQRSGVSKRLSGCTAFVSFGNGLSFGGARIAGRRRSVVLRGRLRRIALAHSGSRNVMPDPL